MYLLRSLFLSFLVCLFGFSFQQMAHAKTVDYPAPSINFKSAFSFTNQTTQATDITQLSQLRGKVVYVDFWASWCVPCRRSFPWMNQMQAKYADDLVILAINLDQDPKLAEAFLAKLPANFHIEYNPSGDIAKAYDVIGMPSSYVIDKTGQVRLTHVGFFKAKQPQYEQSIVALINEVPSL